MDEIALNQFILETAFLYVYEIAGAVIAISVALMLLKLFRDRILGGISNV